MSDKQFLEMITDSALRIGEGVAKFYDQAIHQGKQAWYDHRYDWLAGPARWTRWERAVYGARYIRPADKVLDLCCGDGFFTHLYAQRAAQVIGMDRNEDAIALAQELYSGDNCRFLCSDAVTEPDYGKYDLVTWWDAIEHFTEEEAAIIMGKIAISLLSSGGDGRLIGSTPMWQGTKTNPEHKREFPTISKLEKFLRRWFDGVDTWTSQWDSRRVQMYFSCYYPYVIGPFGLRDESKRKITAAAIPHEPTCNHSTQN